KIRLEFCSRFRHNNVPCRGPRRAGLSMRFVYAAPLSSQSDTSTLEHPHSCDIERRADGAVLVRVHSRAVDGPALPDAVFAFRAGDPQYSYWDAELRKREMFPAAATMPIPLPSFETS